MNLLDAPRPLTALALSRRFSVIMLGVATLVAAPSAFAQQPTPGAAGNGPVGAEERREVVASIARLLEERYVFPQVGVESGAALQAALERGAFDSLDDPKELADALTKALQAVNHDKHMRVVVRPARAVDEERADPIAQHARQRAALSESNFGFQRLERLDGNVGYLDLRGFVPAELGRETAIAAMRLLAGSDAVVIDLRRNGGGSPDMVRLLCSYFFAGRTHLNSLYWRDGDRTEEFWTIDDVEPLLADVPLFIVTSDRTFSAAEEFCYNMQTRRRATLVGEVTGGGANPGGVFAANDRFGIFVPTGRAINPVTKDNWEGKGIRPDVAASADGALDTAIALARAAAETHRTEVAERVRGDRETLARDLKRAEGLFADAQPAEATRVVTAALDAGRASGIVEERLINQLGYDYLARKASAMAVAILEYNATTYPTSANTHDSLGEALLAAGQRERGLASYRRSLELDPRNTNAKAVIERIEKGAQ